MPEVTFPDGTTVRGSSLPERREQDAEWDFGLYCDARWDPSWPAELIAWPDFGLPTDPAKAARQIEDAFERARSGQRVEVGCLGGLGRTGTVLACMATLAGVSAHDAVEWVRAHYRKHAVEGKDQEAVQWFAARSCPKT